MSDSGDRYPRPEAETALWQAALQDAAGPLSAFLSPSGNSLQLMGADRGGGAQHAAFAAAIRHALNLGRAGRLVQLLARGVQPTQTYRQRLVEREGVALGPLHLPRLIARRAAGSPLVPSIDLRRQHVTPENQLVVEAIDVALTDLRAVVAAARGREEAAEASLLVASLQGFVRRDPWRLIASSSRPHLSALRGAVRSLVVGGALSSDSVQARVAELFDLAPVHAIEGLKSSAGPLAVYASQDAAFANRLFELLVGAWVIQALLLIDPLGSVDPRRLRAARGEPVVRVQVQQGVAALFFQTTPAWMVPKWRYVDGGLLRAIPDLTLHVKGPQGAVDLLVDAKNRGAASGSEVLYKMLGYKENLRPGHDYRAVAVLPGAPGEQATRTIKLDGDRVDLLTVGLDSGADGLYHWVKAVVDSITQSA